MRQRVDFPTGWKNQDAETPVDGWIPPPTGCFAPLEGLRSGYIPPVTGGIKMLKRTPAGSFPHRLDVSPR